MSKLSLINREKKRADLVKKFAQKREALKKNIANSAISAEDRYVSRLKLQNIPRNASPCRQRNRCFITGRPRGTFRQFGLGRIKIRELAMRGEIPGMVKSSW